MTYRQPRQVLRAAAIYARAAATGQGRPAGLDAQEARCQREAARRGLVVTKVFRDTGSGLRLARPGLDALRAAVRAGDVRTVLIDSPARLTRDETDYDALLDEWEAAGATLIVAGES
jgi:DNA invertase Pin-like site-specific DNA recombinase